MIQGQLFFCSQYTECRVPIVGVRLMTLDNKEKCIGTEPNFRLLPTATQLLPFFMVSHWEKVWLLFLLLKIPIGLSLFPLFSS